jgi:hypothetical protein
VNRVRLRRDERGSAAPLLLALLAVTVVVVAGVARVGGAAVHRARADATADVVALAAATADPAAAEDVARRGGARLIELRTRADGAVEVRVERSGVVARAAARAVAHPAAEGGR